jgi:hypothetical protein
VTLYPPQFSATFQDGQLQLPAEPLEVPLIVGVSSAGTVATLYDFSNGNTAKNTLGYGPLTEVGLPVLEVSGRALFLKTTGSVAGTNSAVTATRFASSVGTVTISGAAYRDFRGRVLITQTTAALGSGKFKVSLDNGNTYSEELTIPSGGTYTVPNSGITLTFNLQAGTPDFEAGDVHTFTCTCAHWNTTNISDAIAAMLVSPLLMGKKIRKVYWTGIPADSTTAATNAAAIAVHMATLQGLDHFARALMDGGSTDTTANYLTNFVAAFSDTRVSSVYGRCEFTSPLPTVGFGMGYVSGVAPAAVRATEVEISENLMRVNRGPLRGVKSTTLSQDEGVNTAFTADAKTITLRTHRNKPGGAYITAGYLKSPVGSDFKYWDWGVTLDSGAQAIKTAADNWLGEKLRATTDGTGNLNAIDAARVKASIDAPLNALMNRTTVSGLPSHVSGQQTVVETNYDFLSGGDLRIIYKMVPTPAVEGGSITLGLVRQIAEAA